MTDANRTPAAAPIPAAAPAIDLLTAARRLARSQPIEGVPRGRCDIVVGPDGYTIAAFIPTNRIDTANGEQVSVVEFARPE